MDAEIVHVLSSYLSSWGWVTCVKLLRWLWLDLGSTTVGSGFEMDLKYIIEFCTSNLIFHLVGKYVM